MAKVISIGNQSFESIREKDNFYIDKTNFIREWLDNDDTDGIFFYKVNFW